MYLTIFEIYAVCYSFIENEIDIRRYFTKTLKNESYARWAVNEFILGCERRHSFNVGETEVLDVINSIIFRTDKYYRAKCQLCFRIACRTLIILREYIKETIEYKEVHGYVIE